MHALNAYIPPRHGLLVHRYFYQTYLESLSEKYAIDYILFYFKCSFNKYTALIIIYYFTANSYKSNEADPPVCKTKLPKCYIPSFKAIGLVVLHKNILRFFPCIGIGVHHGHVTWTKI